MIFRKIKLYNNGLSLVEILIAITILAVSMLPIWYMQTQSAHRVVKGENQGLIQNIGMVFISQIKKLSVSDLKLTKGFLPIDYSASRKYVLSGLNSKKAVFLPEWNINIMLLKYKVTKLNDLPCDNRLVLLKIFKKFKSGNMKKIIYAGLITNE